MRLLRESSDKGSRRAWIGAAIGLATSAVAGGRVVAQEKSPQDVAAPKKDLPLSEFRPLTKIRTRNRTPPHAKFPVIDVHTHFRVRTRQSAEMLRDYVAVMDRQNIACCVSLDGEMGDAIAEHRQHLEPEHAKRFMVFANLDFRGKGDAKAPATWDCNRDDFAHRSVEALRDAKSRGARGLKFFKAFGLEYKNADGSFIRIDDGRFDPIWDVCGELGLAVIMHTADPSAFFDPIDETNERYEELSRRPDWSFYGGKFPTRESLHAARNRVIERHPKTQFLAAHLGNDGEDLEQVGEWLAQYPNLHVEIASRISELGRQPYSARAFFLKHTDRILFGTDGPWPEQRLSSYWRFLETYDEYFAYSEKPFPPQGMWQIYGIGLPDEVLRKVYHENAMRLLKLDASWIKSPLASGEK